MGVTNDVVIVAAAIVDFSIAANDDNGDAAPCCWRWRPPFSSGEINRCCNNCRSRIIVDISDRSLLFGVLLLLLSDEVPLPLLSLRTSPSPPPLCDETPGGNRAKSMHHGSGRGSGGKSK